MGVLDLEPANDTAARISGRLLVAYIRMPSKRRYLYVSQGVGSGCVPRRCGG